MKYRTKLCIVIIIAQIIFPVFTMEFIVANVDNMKFDIEVALEEQYGALPLPFAGMDSKLLFNVVLTHLNIYTPHLMKLPPRSTILPNCV